MPQARSFVAVYAVAIAVFTASAVLGLDTLRIAVKPVPALVLALWVARAGAAGRFRTAIVVGLGLCAVGDIVLETGSFVPGLVAFLAGHLGYVAAFVGEERRLRPERAAPFALWGLLALAFLWSGLGEMKVPVALYTATICAMMWRASAMVGPARPWAKLVAAGAVIFAVSDTIIAINKFSIPFAGARVLILSLYWTGQLAIAFGAVLRR